MLGSGFVCICCDCFVQVSLVLNAADRGSRKYENNCGDWHLLLLLLLFPEKRTVAEVSSSKTLSHNLPDCFDEQLNRRIIIYFFRTEKKIMSPL